MEASRRGNRLLAGHRAAWPLLVLLLFPGQVAIERVRAEETRSAKLEAVRTFADNVLERGRDRWSGQDTPLLANGLDLDTDEPVTVTYDGHVGVRGEGGEPNTWIIHNLADQQTLFRTFQGLTSLTGDPRYRNAAKNAFQYHFEHLRSPCGLLHWGGHVIIDLRTLRPLGHAWRSDYWNHEVADIFPCYELMWEVDRQATTDFIRAHWNAHILDWGTLAFNRHGIYRKPMGELWNSTFEFPEPFFPVDNVLTFFHAGTDLMYSANMLFMLSGEEGAREWAWRLGDQYVKHRHPKTGLGANQFGRIIRHEEPPEGPLTGMLTWTPYGDRMENQFGQDFPGVACEPWCLFGGRLYTRMASHLAMAEILGEDGKDYLKWTIEGLLAYARHGYDHGENQFRPMWADGTDLTGYVVPRTGYAGTKGAVLRPFEADEFLFFTYASAYRHSGDSEIWRVVRSMMKGLGLGDPGPFPGVSPDLNLATDSSNPKALFALLELHRATQASAYLELADAIGSNILRRCFHKGFFLGNREETTVLFNSLEPLALLSLEAAERGKWELVPAWFGGGLGGFNLSTE